MDLGLTGLRVLISAGANGIGREIAAAFLEEGATVHVCDVSEAALAALPQEISGSRCDVANRDDVDRLMDEAIAALGGLDCLVNNAGIAGPTGAVEAISVEDWDRTLAVNITGQFNCARLAVPHLRASENASIVNLSSIAGRLGFGLRTPYAASKWAVVGFTKSLAIELGGDGIRVNAIAPGLVEGERQDRVLAAKAEQRGITPEQAKTAAMAASSIKRMVSPREIADTVVYLSSLRARTISGQLISIDGDLQTLL